MSRDSAIGIVRRPVKLDNRIRGCCLPSGVASSDPIQIARANPYGEPRKKILHMDADKLWLRDRVHAERIRHVECADSFDAHVAGWRRQLDVSPSILGIRLQIRQQMVDYHLQTAHPELWVRPPRCVGQDHEPHLFRGRHTTGRKPWLAG